MAMLTEKETAKVKKHLEKLGATEPCMRCGDKSYSVCSGFQKTVNMPPPVGNTYNLVLVACECDNCGHVWFHSAYKAFDKVDKEGARSALPAPDELNHGNASLEVKK